ncbi:hypothetical protein G7047_03205 [Diaphorobacter sp. HDW4A]|uniref:hypothetical protein n=1 Tax=Diaphorobacter sp. HDW4A TaxID=2714924 RepID=UPI00140E201C|nr:hypothetical protein [Diaphorobacter sp. HDW4A]QIL79032.1 hypothetical protein G7047_03205 [Diaphorobacter sp. HDW4A]
MEYADHPIVALFRQRAEQLDAAREPRDADEAIVKLAVWMSENIDRLDGDDIEALVQVGGSMFREQLRRRMIRRVK